MCVCVFIDMVYIHMRDKYMYVYISIYIRYIYVYTSICIPKYI